MTGELVHLDVDGVIGVITLDSPHNRNALSARLVAELSDRLDQAAADDAVRAILLRSAGPVFCSGADLTEAAEVEPGARALARVLRAMVSARKPVVAKVAGPVRAGGVGLVAAADIALVADTVTFAFPEVRLGLCPAVISLTTLPRMEPRAAARYFLTGEEFSAAEAARIGLITQAVPAEELDAVTDRVLDRLRQAAPKALERTKGLLTRAERAVIDDLSEHLVSLTAELFASAEGREGIRAFLERRPPAWARQGG
ncbi:enoyl-CoA hydratase family protein [Carbonactinospora thermoautotrophica]|uniref:enoyl-CoA hydratase family protein n=1 Tax=Carbonactinospora thermoautotrophica TaxID=1469144 RepID=UPI003DA9E83E